MAPIYLVVAAHEPYLRFLPDLLCRWDSFGVQFDRKFLALDNCSYAPPRGWHVVRGSFGHPCGPRNLAVSRMPSGWVIFWDADNMPSESLVRGYLDALRNDQENSAVGVYVPIARDGMLFGVRDFREWESVDTASLWRVEALRAIGGWDETGFPLSDNELAMRVSEAGWKLVPISATIDFNMHGANWRGVEPAVESRWKCKSMGVIGVYRGLGGASDLEKWGRAVAAHEFPPRSGLTLVNNCHGPCRRESRSELMGLAAYLSPKFTRITVLDCEIRPHLPHRSDFSRVHSEVGTAYAQAFAATPEPIILTWEDDVFPDSPRAAWTLQTRLNYPAAAVAAAVPERQKPHELIASLQCSNKWCPLPWDHVRGRLVRVSATGGGFTLWSRPAIERECFTAPIVATDVPSPGYLWGWDGWLCRRLTAANRSLWVDGGVTCSHAGVSLATTTRTSNRRVRRIA